MPKKYSILNYLISVVFIVLFSSATWAEDDEDLMDHLYSEDRTEENHHSISNRFLSDRWDPVFPSGSFLNDDWDPVFKPGSFLSDDWME